MDLFDNRYVMDFDEALHLVKYFFGKELPLFAIQEEYNKNNGYWGARYLHSGQSVFIGGDRGYLATKISVHDKTVSLSDFDPLMNEVKVASEKNIRFTLEVIKRYITLNIL
ncbi:MAG: hypothetical protein ABIN67_10520 [Ferruginibacter sp.]